MWKVIGGLAVALALAAGASGATLFGIELWKIALAAVGAAIFVVGGRTSGRRR